MRNKRMLTVATGGELFANATGSSNLLPSSTWHERRMDNRTTILETMPLKPWARGPK